MHDAFNLHPVSGSGPMPPKIKS